MDGGERITSARLVGEKVLLRPIRPDDATEAFVLINGREPILQWLLWKGPTSVQELRDSFSSWRRWNGPNSGYMFAIEERATGAFVGTISVRFGDHPELGDIGYWLAEDVWGRGFATEAIELLAYFAFEHTAAATLSAWVFVGNDASRRALEKNGFLLVRTALQKVERDGIARDEWYFVLLGSEWNEERGGWRPRSESVERE